MSLKKTVAIAAVAGALAAISVPAMALENEFHGLYNFNFTGSNFQDGGSGDFFPGGNAGFTGANGVAVKAVTPWASTRQMNNYFEQRARIFYTAKVSDDLKLVTGFELDARFGSPPQNGAAGYPAVGKYTSTDAGKLDADGISLETKWVYLDFNVGKDFNTKLGIQPYKDTLKGLFIDADVPAVMTATKFGAYTLGLGFSRYADDAGLSFGTATPPTASSSRLGDNAKDLFIWDNTFTVTKDTKVALSYYFLADYAATTTGGYTTFLDQKNQDQDVLLNTLALSGETKVGDISLSGFAAMQAGHQKHVVGASLGNPATSPLVGSRASDMYFHGLAANIGAKLAVGPGTLRSAFLYTSGGNGGSQYKGWVTSSVNSYNEGGMMILARSTANSPTSTDRYIRKNVTNLSLLTVGYDANLTDKTFLNGNIGLGFAPSTADAPVNKSTLKGNTARYMGTEINLEAGYKLYSNLTLKAQAAYMMLGGYYAGSASDSKPGSSKDPENPYSLRLHAQFKF
jgi:hypothetical protein